MAPGRALRRAGRFVRNRSTASGEVVRHLRFMREVPPYEAPYFNLTVGLRELHCAAFNPLARRLVATRAAAEHVVVLDRRLEHLPLVNRCFDTLLVAATRR